MTSYSPRKTNETGPPISGIIGSSPAMNEVYQVTRRVARSNASVCCWERPGRARN